MQREQHPTRFSTKASEYSYRVPSPPRIVVPPPSLESNTVSHIALHTHKSAEFLNSGHDNNGTTQSSILDWSYERRRDAQMILPNLLLGPQSVLKNNEFLQSSTSPDLGDNSPTQITMILGIAQRDSFHNKVVTAAMRRAEGQGIETHVLLVGDNQDLIHSFPQATCMINKHFTNNLEVLGRPGRVLVCCESGNERSASVVAAYLMEVLIDVDYIKAMQLIQAQRFCVNFDDSIKRLLQSYWDILSAQRQVADLMIPRAEANQTVSRKSSALLKRAFHGTEVTDSATDDDERRFEGRRFVPFVDGQDT